MASIFIVLVEHVPVAAFSTRDQARKAARRLRDSSVEELPLDPRIPSPSENYYCATFTKVGSLVGLTTTPPDSLGTSVLRWVNNPREDQYSVEAWGTSETIVPLARQLLFDHLAKPAKS